MKAYLITGRLFFIIALFTFFLSTGSLLSKITENNSLLPVNRCIYADIIFPGPPCNKDFHRSESKHFFTVNLNNADSVNYKALRNEPLNASSYHQIRGGVSNSLIKFEREKKGRVAFLGGSITYNPGWRDSICAYLQTRFPETEFDFIPAGIPSMGSTPSAFRLKRDVLSAGKVDLLFQEAAVNDNVNGRTPREQIRAMEGIVRHLRTSNPEIDIVFMHFVDPDKIRDYNRGIEPEVITNHNRVADHYNIPTINLAKEVADRIDNGEFTWKDDFKDLHPSPFGQGVYANSIICFLNGIYPDKFDTKGKVSETKLPDKIDKFSYDNGLLVDVTSAVLSEGWDINKSWNPGDGTNTRPGFVDVPMLVSNIPGSLIKLPFKGTAVGIVVAAGQDAGVIEYRIDKNEWTNLNLYTQWSSQIHLPWYYTLSGELSEDEHLLEIRIAGTKDRRSNGTACRIRYFFINML